MTAKHEQIKQVARVCISGTVALMLCLCLWTSQAKASEGPVQAVQNGTNQVLHLLKEYHQDTPALREKIRAVVDRYFDFDAIAKRALGRRWRSEPPEKMREFTRYFSRLLFNTYIGKIENYTDEKITYGLQQKGDDYAVVDAVVTGSQVGKVTLQYYMHLKGGSWKVYDVVIEGVGLVTNYRGQFNSILTRSSFDDLLKQLKEKASES